jgi:hypothetical protein
MRAANTKTTWALAFGLAALLTPKAFGFSSDGSALTRSFQNTSGLTNAAIVVNAVFTNAEAVSLRGFYYADQVPSGLNVSTLGVTLNGQSVTNYSVEVGTNGDVYAGCTPYRWVVEEPSAFWGWTCYTNASDDIAYQWNWELPAGSTQTNPVPPADVLQIVYAVNSAAAGVFNLQQFSWAAFNPLTTNSAFGYSETADEQTLTVLSNPPSCTLTAFSSNGLQLQINGIAAIRYAIESSSNMLQWSSLATNTLPWTYSVARQGGIPTRFYRARWVP